MSTNKQQPTAIDKDHVLNEVIKIAQRTGQFIRHEGENFDRSKIEEKSLNNLVSYVDFEAEKMIVQTLKFTIPDSGFITEEGTETEKAKEFNWIVDPLDGTTNFLHGVPPFSVSIALTQYDKLILGVVYEITRDECFHATDESPAFLNRKEIKVSPVKDFKDGLYITGFPYREFSQIDQFTNTMKYFVQHSHGLRRTGSAAADLAYVACGRVEGFFEVGLNPWDVAAGSLILERAGGKVTDYKGKDDYLYGSQIVASNGFVHEGMTTAVQKFYK